jgi:nucleoside-diphosphate-sugar epimerase
MQARDFISTTDVAAAIWCFLTSEAEGPVNIGTGFAVRVRDFVSQAASFLRRPVQLEFDALPLGPDQPSLIVAATERLRNEVRYAPARNITEGLSKAISEAGLA